MPVFEPDIITEEMRRLWVQTAKFGFKDSSKLCDEYWKEYNTVTIPLRDMDEFFADAILAAKHAQDRDHLETLLAEQRENRWKELKKSTTDVAYASCTRKQYFPSRAVKDAALDAGRTGSLSSFLHFIFCATASWNAARDASDESSDQPQPSLRGDRPNVDDNRHSPGQLDGQDYGAGSEDDWEHDNNHAPPMSPIPDISRLQDDAWNAWTKYDRVCEADEADQKPPTRQLGQASSAATALVKEGESREHAAVADQTSDSLQDDAPAPSTSPQTETETTDHTSPPQSQSQSQSRPPPSPTSKDTPLITAAGPSPGPSQTKAPPSQASPGLSSTEAVDASQQLVDPPKPPSKAEADSSSHGHGSSPAAGLDSAKKRPRPEDDGWQGESNDIKHRKFH